MNIQIDKFEILNNVLTFISGIIAIINSINQNYNVIFYVSMILVLIAGSLSCFYWIRRNSTWKRYKFIRYLFFETKENKFNIAPKILLFLDLKNKKNRFEVNELFVNYTLTEDNGIIDSNMKWKLKGISNVISNDFYFYTGIDLGKIQNFRFIINYNGVPETRNLLPDNQIDSENDIFLCHWDIPDYAIKKGNKVDEIELIMEQKNSFDFNNKETIYFFPWNFARKIGQIKFIITYPMSLGELSMQLFEVGKVRREKFPSHHSLDTTAKEKFLKNEDNCTFTYEFYLDKDINVENMYYILLQKNNQ